MRSLAKCFSRLLRIISNHACLVNAAFARITAHLGMNGLVMNAHLGHITQHQNLFAIELRQYLNRCAYGIWISVIAIIDQLIPLFERLGLHSPLNGTEGRSEERRVGEVEGGAD